MNLYFTQIDPPAEGLTGPLAEKGWQLRHLPFRRVADRAVALAAEEGDLWLITSKNAARWVMRQGFGALPRLAVVGAATAALLPGDRLVFPPQEGPVHAADLAKRLRAMGAPAGRACFLCGDKARPFPDVGFPVVRHEVYETPLIRQNSAPPESASMVYFQAPSTVADFHRSFRTKPGIIAVIGPTTAKAAESRGWAVDFQPGRPESTCFVNEVPPPERFTKDRSI